MDALDRFDDLHYSLAIVEGQEDWDGYSTYDQCELLLAAMNAGLVEGSLLDALGENYKEAEIALGEILVCDMVSGGVALQTTMRCYFDESMRRLCLERLPILKERAGVQSGTDEHLVADSYERGRDVRAALRVVE